MPHSFKEQKINSFSFKILQANANIALQLFPCTHAKNDFIHTCVYLKTATKIFSIDSGCYDVVEQNQRKLSSVDQNVSSATTVYKVLNNPVLPDLR